MTSDEVSTLLRDWRRSGLVFEDAHHVIAASYSIDGDTLKLCVDEANIKERPKEMASKEGSQQVLAVFKRQKK